jgi:hypothetical protein
MKLPSGVRPKSVELLKAERTIPFHFADQLLQFAIPTVGDYEVAAITVA